MAHCKALGLSEAKCAKKKHRRQINLKLFDLHLISDKVLLHSTILLICYSRPVGQVTHPHFVKCACAKQLTHSTHTHTAHTHTNTHHIHTHAHIMHAPTHTHSQTHRWHTCSWDVVYRHFFAKLYLLGEFSFSLSFFIILYKRWDLSPSSNFHLETPFKFLKCSE